MVLDSIFGEIGGALGAGAGGFAEESGLKDLGKYVIYAGVGLFILFMLIIVLAFTV